MKTSFTYLACVFLVTCVRGAPVIGLRASDHSRMNWAPSMDAGDTLTLRGVLVKEPFRSKKGKEMAGVYDYYFATGTENYFIKTTEGVCSKDRLEELIREDANGRAEDRGRTFRVVLESGAWDIAPNDAVPPQSRIGPYIRILDDLGRD